MSSKFMGCLTCTIFHGEIDPPLRLVLNNSLRKHNNNNKLQTNTRPSEQTSSSSGSAATELTSSSFSTLEKVVIPRLSMMAQLELSRSSPYIWLELLFSECSSHFSILSNGNGGSAVIRNIRLKSTI